MNVTIVVSFWSICHIFVIVAMATQWKKGRGQICLDGAVCTAACCNSGLLSHLPSQEKTKLSGTEKKIRECTRLLPPEVRAKVKDKEVGFYGNCISVTLLACLEEPCHVALLPADDGDPLHCLLCLTYIACHRVKVKVVP